MNSTQVIKEAIYLINGNRNGDSATVDARVNAEVNNCRVVDDTLIRIHFTFDGTNYADINIFWEDADIKDYKKRGLFGVHNTRYAKASTNFPGEIEISDGAIFILIRTLVQDTELKS